MSIGGVWVPLSGVFQAMDVAKEVNLYPTLPYASTPLFSCSFLLGLIF